tara:strand:- start:1498 stop:2223 length:726 start_codon:yes stop_codon:yes gene_type:complete
LYWLAIRNRKLLNEIREIKMKKLLNEWDSFLKEAHCNTGHGNRSEDQNDDGANNFEDVKIAKMKASGMSEKEIREKHPELFEEDVKHPPQYSAPEGSKRDSKLDDARKLYKSGDVESAVRLRQNMEKEERKKKDFKNKPRPDSQKEYRIRMSKEQLIEMIHNTLHEELSKKTEKTLRKKAEDRGLTFGSVKKEYKKGLAAWVSSGSRKGMSQHQWAMARVNSANPSKSWAVVKKSKAKKKK